MRLWLRAPGLVVVGVLYVLGSLLVFADDSGRKGFLASPGQLVGAATVVLALIVLAALPRWRRRPAPGPGVDAPRPVLAGGWPWSATSA
ncbi:hypothetical protein JMF97_11020 [Micromonospora fiedleri]|uniref:Uncharacterized protein n=1 Tax=Micromonospora fiedleri TaxID=1157498 RepID=A0ABS1UK22_9ACTN|nr:MULTISPECIES: hypothetical protein [Micromonospora]MBL6276693.1 hypothetical protein [Micromonospora fiedleri]WSK43588.1 hypothetical protein OG712_05405 [Micromonospora maris]